MARVTYSYRFGTGRQLECAFRTGVAEYSTTVPTVMLSGGEEGEGTMYNVQSTSTYMYIITLSTCACTTA